MFTCLPWSLPLALIVYIVAGDDALLRTLAVGLLIDVLVLVLIAAITLLMVVWGLL